MKVAYRAPLAVKNGRFCSFMLKTVTFDTFAGVGIVDKRCRTSLRTHSRLFVLSRTKTRLHVPHSLKARRQRPKGLILLTDAIKLGFVRTGQNVRESAERKVRHWPHSPGPQVPGCASSTSPFSTLPAGKPLKGP